MLNPEQFAELQIQTYRRVASIFDSVTKRNNRNHINKIRAIDKFLDIRDGDKVAEIGIGTGIHAKFLLDVNCDKKFEFIGVDISEEMIVEARKKLGTKTDLRTMRGEHLEFTDGYFDKIYISGSLHHFSDQKKGIDELLRVLKAGGKFCIMEPNFLFPKNYWAAYRLLEEKNMRLMKKNNFHDWLNKHSEIDYSIDNFAYAPPHPIAWSRFYDFVDRTLHATPFLRSLSIMLFISGIKR